MQKPSEKPYFTQPKPDQPTLITKSKVYICVDVDSFFAQCDSRKLGLENSVPLIHVQWGLCVSVNYAARARGVKPYSFTRDAQKVCPEVVVSHADTFKTTDDITDPYALDVNEKMKTHDKKTEKVSLERCRMEADKIFTMLESYSKTVEKASFDEAFLDVTPEAMEIYKRGDYPREWKGKVLGGEPFEPEEEQDILLMIGTQIAHKILTDIEKATKYTCSAGIASNKMLCKLGSGLNKPFGQSVFLPRYHVDALKPINLSKIRNFGRKIQEAFEAHKVTKLGEVHDLNLQQLQEVLGDPNTARWVYFRARGFDDEEVKDKEFATKSISSSKFMGGIKTMPEFVVSVELIISELHARLLKYFEKYKMVPKTLVMHYYDQEKYRTKSEQINLKRKTEDFKKVLTEKGFSMVNTVKDTLFPVGYFALSVKDFEKNDFSEFEYDLVSFFGKKGNGNNANLSGLMKPQATQDANNSHGNYAELMKPQITTQEFGAVRSSTVATPMAIGTQKDENSMIIEEEEDLIEAMLNKAEEVQEEKVNCERCNILIVKSQMEAHLDFHTAQDLDRELNPKKKKYKAGQGVGMEEKEKVNSNGEQQGKKESLKQQRSMDFGDYGADLKKVKKTTTNGIGGDAKGKDSNGNKPATLDKFFGKR